MYVWESSSGLVGLANPLQLPRFVLREKERKNILPRPFITIYNLFYILGKTWMIWSWMLWSIRQNQNVSWQIVFCFREDCKDMKLLVTIKPKFFKIVLSYFIQEISHYLLYQPEYMLTLESQCIPMLVLGVLCIRTLPNR